MNCRTKQESLRRFSILLVILVVTGALQAEGIAKWLPCDERLLVKRIEQGQEVGQEECWMREIDFQFDGKAYRRLDIGVNGSVLGYAVKEGTRARYFTDRPEFVFHQLGQKGWLKGTAHYYSSGGVGITVVLPESSANWNGKLYLHVHGAGTCAGEGRSRRRLDPAEPMGDLSRYNEIMLKKGYVVVATGPAATNSAGLDTIPGGTGVCTRVELRDGTILYNLNLTDHGQFHVDLVRLAKNIVRASLDRAPSRTYWYGHSSGTRVGRLINFIPELNFDEEGKPLIDGFLGDDPAAGLWLPIRFEGNRDVLFANTEDKKGFRKQIDIVHHLMADVKSDPMPEEVSRVTLINKRNSARIFRDKGLSNRYRMYELRGVSHSGGDDKARSLAPDVRILDLSPFIDALIDLLDAWVEEGKGPPPTKSDWPELGDKDGDGVNENEAVAFPEVACPLGVFHAYPPSSGDQGKGVTGFAEFDGKEEEPVDGRGVFVDMNRNGYRDQRESVTDAWRRLGLLKPGESFSREKYVECLRSSVSKLSREGFISEQAARSYIEQARSAEFPSR